MFTSPLPSRAGFALALTALLIPIAISRVSTVVAHTAVAQATADTKPASHRSTASGVGNRAYCSAVDPIGTALLPGVWCRRNSGADVRTVTCQTGTPWT
jgi:hypothetical protein